MRKAAFNDTVRKGRHQRAGQSDLQMHLPLHPLQMVRLQEKAFVPMYIHKLSTQFHDTGQVGPGCLSISSHPRGAPIRVSTNLACASLIARSTRSEVAKSWESSLYFCQQRSFLLGPNIAPPSPATTSSMALGAKRAKYCRPNSFPPPSKAASNPPSRPVVARMAVSSDSLSPVRN